MNYHIHLIGVGVVAVFLTAYLPLQISNQSVSSILTVFISVFSLLIVFLITKISIDKDNESRIGKLKSKYENRIRRLKKEHDTTTLEKTIRDGTRTLIKNAVDYFKIENIKNEMPPSAAIQNLQLDKYGQIIELLADFSLILPDYQENLQIVQQEINHQIHIYQIDEEPFAKFLERIMEKYSITVNKKIREKVGQNELEGMKTCPECAERVLSKARVCKHCGYNFESETFAKPYLVQKKTKDDEDAIKGEEFAKSENYEEAIQLLNKVISLNPESGQAYYHRGMIHEKMGNQGKFLEDLATAAKLGHKKAEHILVSQKVSV